MPRTSPASTYIILVKLLKKGKRHVLCFTPDDLHVCHGIYRIEWRRDCDGEQFEFPEKPSIIGKVIPFKDIKVEPTKITCTDDNRNNVETDIPYEYSLRVRANGSVIDAAVNKAGPYIRNKPS